MTNIIAATDADADATATATTTISFKKNGYTYNLRLRAAGELPDDWPAHWPTSWAPTGWVGTRHLTADPGLVCDAIRRAPDHPDVLEALALTTVQ